MFKITPIQSTSDAIAYANACNAIIKDGCFVYAMTDCESGEIMGFSQFELLEGHGYIYDLKEASGRNDFEAMFILGRQTMCFIESCGASICTAAHDAGDPKLLHAIGFRDGGDRLSCDMTGMFDGHCGNH